MSEILSLQGLPHVSVNPYQYNPIHTIFFVSISVVPIMFITHYLITTLVPKLPAPLFLVNPLWHS